MKSASIIDPVQRNLVHHLQKQAVSKYNLGSVAQLTSAQQNDNLIQARTWCYKKLRNAGLTYSRIADYFNKEKTSVRYCVKK